MGIRFCLNLSGKPTKESGVPAGEWQAVNGGEEKESGAARILCGQWSLNGATALVTGGSKGIGHANVEELAVLGAIVHTCCRNGAELESCLQNWENLGFKVTGSICDVSSRTDRENLIQEVSSMFNGKLNILVNIAGTNIRKPTLEYTAEDFAFLMATNLESAFHLSQLAYPLLKASGEGSIVFISSLSAFIGIRNVTIYSATKGGVARIIGSFLSGALIQLTSNFPCEWSKDGKQTNFIAPGLIRTPLVRPLVDDKEALAKLVDLPLRRIREPKDVASMTVFFYLPAASYITGQVMIKGGASVLEYLFSLNEANGLVVVVIRCSCGATIK